MPPTNLVMALGACTLVPPAATLARKGWRNGGARAAVVAYAGSIAVVTGGLYAFRRELVPAFFALLLRFSVAWRVALLLLVVTAAIRAAWFFAKDRATDDVHVRIASAFGRAAGGGRLARIAAGEVSALYYGTLSWRARPSAPPEHTAFSYRECDGHLATLTGLVALLGLETTILHFLVAPHSAVAAWTLSSLGAYAMIWAAADHRASVLRPILVSANAIVVRAGIRGTAVLPRASIRCVSAASRTPPDRRTYARMTLLARPDFVVELREPTAVKGLFGMTRLVTSVGLAVDDPAAFADALTRLGIPVGEIPARDPGDFVDRLREGLRGIVRKEPVAEALARELALFACALFFWRLTPSADARRFTVHKKGGYALVLGTLLFVSCLEIFVVDLLLRRASPAAANVLLVIGAYTIAWLFGDFQALRVRPIVLGQDALLVRIGVRREARIPLRDIESIEGAPADQPRRAPDYIRCTSFGPAEIVLRLRAPARFHQMIGRPRDVVRVGLTVDDEPAFRRAVLAAAERARDDSERALARQELAQEQAVDLVRSAVGVRGF